MGWAKNLITVPAALLPGNTVRQIFRIIENFETSNFWKTTITGCKEWVKLLDLKQRRRKMKGDNWCKAYQGMWKERTANLMISLPARFLRNSGNRFLQIKYKGKKTKTASLQIFAIRSRKIRSPGHHWQPICSNWRLWFQLFRFNTFF